MKEIYMDFSPVSIRCVLTENGRLLEVLTDSEENASVVGNIYAARVENIIKGQFAFLNIGLEKNGFLQLDDFKQRGLTPSMATPGAQLNVQVLKDQTNEKGAYLSCELSFSGRFVIITKGLEDTGNINVSQKIGDNDERLRLKAIAAGCLPDGFGVILRTESMGVDKVEIVNEIKALAQAAKDIINKSDFIKAPSLLSGEELAYAKSLKALLGDSVKRIVINAPEELENVRNIALNNGGISSECVELYEGDIDLFDILNIESQIEKALHEKIWLKSGGVLIIEQTKTCAFIDVNTGKFVNKKNREQTVIKNNMEAAQEIAIQIRLRNLSGVIIVDFVNMKEVGDKKNLLAYFAKELKKDRIVATIVDYGELNMVQLTRKKMRPPLLEQMTDSCVACGGTGRVLNIENITNRVYKKINRILAQTIFNKITVEANKKVINVLKKSNSIESLIKKYNAEIELKIIETGRLDYFEISKEKKGV